MTREKRNAQRGRNGADRHAGQGVENRRNVQRENVSRQRSDAPHHDNGQGQQRRT